jgi:hypothetical protein
MITIPDSDYSILHIKLTYIRLVYQLCISGNITALKTRARAVPFNRDIEMEKADNVVSEYLQEKRRTA